MITNKSALLLTVLLFGCATTDAERSSLPVPLLIPAPDARVYFSASKNPYQGTLYYRDALIAYRKYLNSQIDLLSKDLGLKEVKVVEVGCQHPHIALDDLKLLPVPDVIGKSDAEITDILIKYIADTRRTISKHNERLRNVIKYHNDFKC